MSMTNPSFKEKIILGIDPGTNVMGYGILKVQNKKMESLSMGAVQIKEVDYILKLQRILEKIEELIEEFQPDEVSVEAPFYGKNVQSMLKLGRAQGVAISAALRRSIPVTEYSPRKIKQSITGSGAASKEQVAGMLQQLLKLDRLPKYLDATDGMAVAVCHHLQSSSAIPSTGAKSWESFIKKNPGRIK